MRVNQEMNFPLTGVTGKKLVSEEGSPLKVVGAAHFIFTWYLNNNSLEYIFCGRFITYTGNSESTLIEELCKILKISKTRINAYHPHT